MLRHRSLGRIFHAREPAETWETFNWLHDDSILENEPPKHTRLRALVAKAFARGHVERLRPRVRELAGDAARRGGRARRRGRRSTWSPTTPSRCPSW